MGWAQQQVLRSFDMAGISQVLALAPHADSPEAKSRPLAYDLPMPDGTTKAFHFARFDLMAPEFAAQYPDFFTDFRGAN